MRHHRLWSKPFEARVTMTTTDIHQPLRQLFSELVDGAPPRNAFMLNSGDIGLLRSLDNVSAGDASHAVDGGATIAAHAQHVRYGLSLMNRWATDGGDPFADAKWEEAWKVAAVNDAEWEEIRHGLRDEAHQWLVVLGTPREASGVQLTGMIASIAHIGYHMGAIRQIAKVARGPREGVYG
jgi:hypothetical protein